MVKAAHELKREKGVLEEPSTKSGRGISNETVHIVKQYYEGEEISRILPGKKDFFSSIMVDTARVHKQKDSYYLI